MKKSNNFFRKYYKNNLLSIRIYIISNILTKVCFLAIPYATKLLIDSVQASNLYDLKKYTIANIVLLILFQIFLSTKYYFKDILEVSITSKIKGDLINKSMVMSFNKFKSITSGEFIQRVFDDSEVVTPLIIDVYVETIINIIYSICICLIMFTFNVYITLMLIALVPVFILICKVYLPLIDKSNKAVIQEEEKLKTIAEETLNGSFDIRVNNAYKYIKTKLYNNIENYIKSSKNKIKYDMQYNYIFTTGIMNIATLLIYCFGGYLVIQNQFSIGVLLSFTLYFSRLWDPVEYFLDLPKNYKVYKISLDRIKDFLSLDNECNIEPKQLPEFQCIDMKNISFSYNDKNILSNVDFNISKGDIIGIKGANGSGKSTLANILTKFQSVDKGSVFFNNIDFTNIHPDNLREKIIYVPANGYVFKDSILNNITLGNTEENLLEEIMRKYSLIDIIKNNDISLDTYVNDNDNKISSGEKKIIQILRGALLRGELYIFDEPTNFIDKNYKKIMLDFIKMYFKDKTIVIISHDEEVFDYCNKVYCLSDKKLIEL